MALLHQSVNWSLVDFSSLFNSLFDKIFFFVTAALLLIAVSTLYFENLLNAFGGSRPWISAMFVISVLNKYLASSIPFIFRFWVAQDVTII